MKNSIASNKANFELFLTYLSHLKWIPGNSDFLAVVTSPLYVDKTDFIYHLLGVVGQRNENASILLITRPWRFGKTLNMSMLYYFLSQTIDGEKNQTKATFQQLKINNHPVLMDDHHGKYVVIHMTLKDLKTPDKVSAVSAIYELMRDVYSQFEYLKNNNFLTQYQRESFSKILDKKLDKKVDEDEIKNSLKQLIKLLYDYHKGHTKGIYLLIDDYDHPLNRCMEDKEAKEFITGFLKAALKDNKYLHRAILTGISKVAQEGLFSDLNNVTDYSLLNDTRYSLDYGFTANEVREVNQRYLKVCPSEEVLASQLQWYGGYRIGQQKVKLCNPWSIMAHLNKNEPTPFAHWTNTSTAKLIEEILKVLNEKNPAIHKKIQSCVAALYRREQVWVTLDEHLSYKELKEKESAFWTLLHTTGYLTVKGPGEKHVEYNLEIMKYRISLPNQEIIDFFQGQIENDVLVKYTALVKKNLPESILKGLKKLIRLKAIDDAVTNSLIELLLFPNSLVLEKVQEVLEKFKKHIQHQGLLVSHYYVLLAHSNDSISQFAWRQLVKLGLHNSDDTYQKLLKNVKEHNTQIMSNSLVYLRAINKLHTQEVFKILTDEIEHAQDNAAISVLFQYIVTFRDVSEEMLVIIQQSVHKWIKKEQAELRALALNYFITYFDRSDAAECLASIVADVFVTVPVRKDSLSAMVRQEWLEEVGPPQLLFLLQREPIEEMQVYFIETFLHILSIVPERVRQEAIKLLTSLLSNQAVNAPLKTCIHRCMSEHAALLLPYELLAILTQHLQSANLMALIELKTLLSHCETSKEFITTLLKLSVDANQTKQVLTVLICINSQCLLQHEKAMEFLVDNFALLLDEDYFALAQPMIENFCGMHKESILKKIEAQFDALSDNETKYCNLLTSWDFIKPTDVDKLKRLENELKSTSTKVRKTAFSLLKNYENGIPLLVKHCSDELKYHIAQNRIKNQKYFGEYKKNFERLLILQKLQRESLDDLWKNLPEAQERKELASILSRHCYDDLIKMLLSQLKIYSQSQEYAVQDFSLVLFKRLLIQQSNQSASLLQEQVEFFLAFLKSPHREIRKRTSRIILKRQGLEKNNKLFKKICKAATDDTEPVLAKEALGLLGKSLRAKKTTSGTRAIEEALTKEPLKAKANKAQSNLQQLSIVPKIISEVTESAPPFLDALALLKEELQLYYSQEATITLPVFHTPQHVKDSYVHLAFVENAKQSKEEKERLLHHDTLEQRPTALENRNLTYEDIYKVGEEAKVEDIFKNAERVLVIGRAGIGKSTFCKYIAYQWSLGTYWKHFEHLLWIQLRHITTYSFTDNSGEELISSLIVHAMQAQIQQEGHDRAYPHLTIHAVETALNSQSCLFLLDGYDEIASFLKGEPLASTCKQRGYPLKAGQIGQK